MRNTVKKMWDKFSKAAILPFAAMYQGGIAVKIEISALLALALTPFIWVMDKIAKLYGAYEPIFNRDSEFLKILVLFLFFDLVLGMWKHWVQKTFDWTKMYKGLMTKIAISLIGMFLFNAFASIPELINFSEISVWIALTGKVMNIVYVGGSAFNNMFVLSGGKFPPVAFMQRFEKFNKTLSLNVFKGSEEETNNKAE